MEKLKIKEIFKNSANYENKDITLEGWIRTVRDSKTFGFIELNDGSFFKNIQIVFTDTLENFETIKKLTISSSIKVTGTLVITKGAKQPFEIQAKSIDILDLCPQEYPLQKKRHSFEYLRTIAHLRPRTNTFYAVFRVRSVLSYAIHKFFQERGFVYVHTPIITSSDAEGAGEMFNVNSFSLENLVTRIWLQILSGDLQFAHAPVLEQGVLRSKRIALIGAASFLARDTASSTSLTTLFIPTMSRTFFGPQAMQATRFPTPSILTRIPSSVMALVLARKKSLWKILSCTSRFSSGDLQVSLL